MLCSLVAFREEGQCRVNIPTRLWWRLNLLIMLIWWRHFVDSQSLAFVQNLCGLRSLSWQLEFILHKAGTSHVSMLMSYKILFSIYNNPAAALSISRLPLPILTKWLIATANASKTLQQTIWSHSYVTAWNFKSRRKRKPFIADILYYNASCNMLPVVLESVW